MNKRRRFKAKRKRRERKLALRVVGTIRFTPSAFDAVIDGMYRRFALRAIDRAVGAASVFTPSRGVVGRRLR